MGRHESTTNYQDYFINKRRDKEKIDIARDFINNSDNLRYETEYDETLSDYEDLDTGEGGGT